MKMDIEGMGLPACWRSLRETAAAQGWVLNQAVIDQLQRIFWEVYAAGEVSPGVLTREFERDEFLLVVDEQGQPSGTGEKLLEGCQKTTAAQTGFAKWLRIDKTYTSAGGEQPVLLAARWLCHLAGLRHGTVEIFIDPPHLEGHTLVQVRGLDKFEAPGAFDIPCAGHISGVDSAEMSLRKELEEELNLALDDDLSDFHPLERYNSYTIRLTDGPLNNEYRVLYRARLKAESAGRIRFSDGEVAGLAVFAISELRELVRRYPERVASGLGDAMQYYHSRGE
jgi:isopentenyldiphosphate isomerase